MPFQCLTKSFCLGDLAFENPILKVLMFRRSCNLRHEVLHHVPTVETRLSQVHFASLTKLQGFVVEVGNSRFAQRMQVGKDFLQSVFTDKACPPWRLL